jgi:glycosyltransferase involved in cell wall biosynthesis
MHAPVSACVIARNEAATLAACISSLNPVVAEVVVLDTGSTDGTPAVARASGARVHTFAWADDFAAARNAAAKHAQKPFILMVDADEQLAPGGGEALAATPVLPVRRQVRLRPRPSAPRRPRQRVNRSSGPWPQAAARQVLG